MFFRRFFIKRADSVPGETPTIWTWLFWAALLVLLYVFGLALVQYFQTAQMAIRFPYPLDYKEGPTLNQVLRLAQGQPVYRSDLTTPPFSISFDPPLFWLFQWPFAKLFGLAYAYGRLLAILGALLSALFLGLTLWSITQDGVGAVIAGLTLLAFPYLLYGSVIDQADALALAFSWGGLFVIARWPGRKFSPYAAALLFTLAIGTRQTYFLAGPLTAVAWLIYRQAPRQAFWLVGLTIALCLAAFLLTNLLTHGAFYFTLVKANVAPFSWKMVAGNFSRFFPDTYYFFLSTLLFLIVERISDRSQTWPFILAYFIGSLASAMYSGWFGSTTSAFFELIAAFAFAAGAIIVWMKHSIWLKVILVLLLAVQLGDLVRWSRAEFIPQISEKVTALSDLSKVDQLVRSAEGSVLSDEYLGMVPLTGQPILFQPIEFKLLNEHGVWDDQLVIAQINQKGFSYILFYIPVDNGQYLTERWSQNIREAVYANYQLVDTLASVYIYRPKP